MQFSALQAMHGCQPALGTHHLFEFSAKPDEQAWNGELHLEQVYITRHQPQHSCILGKGNKEKGTKIPTAQCNLPFATVQNPDIDL